VARYLLTGPYPDAGKQPTGSLRAIYSFIILLYESDSSVGIATGYRLDGPGSNLHSVQTDFEAHSASYPMDSGGSFPGGKAVGASS
jgi:hypothetical protein